MNTETDNWAVKYRPMELADVKGQTAAKATIAGYFQASVEGREPSQAWLLTGPLGTGKTTLARIIGKRLNCEDAAAEDGAACNRCRACRGVIDDNHPDWLELDAATHTGVERMREILSHAVALPAWGRRRVLLIDEAHMLSTAAGNAMLKRLEEPPKHLFFILVTTEPEGILPTVRSRCTAIELRPLTTRETIEQLHEITEKENKEVPDQWIQAIAKAAAGGARDAISMLQSIATARGVDDAVVAQICGTVASEIVDRARAAIANNDPKGLKEVVEDNERNGCPRVRTWTAIAHQLCDSETDRTRGAPALIIERADQLRDAELGPATSHLLAYEICGLGSCASTEPAAE